MKSLILSIALLLTAFSFGQETEGITIEVTIDNVTSNKGKVLFGLHTSDTFMVAPGVQNKESKIEEGKVTVTFEGVVPGTYAIIALHDENENGRMDFEANGMPKENYGSSNNPMAYGPPQFAESKFEVSSEDLKMSIRF